MEKDKNISLGDSYLEKQGDEKQVAHFEDDTLNGKKIELSRKSLPKNPVKLSKKNLKKVLK